MTPLPSWQTIGLLVVLLAVTHALVYGLWQRRICQGGKPLTDDDTIRRNLAVIAGICVLLFAALTIALFTTGFVGRVDNTIRSWVQVLQDDAFVQLFSFITAMGNVATVVAVTLVAAGLLWAQGRRRTVAGLALSVLASQATTYIAKYAIARDRPEFEAFAHAATPSYPSAHATSAVAVYGFIVYAMACRLPPTRLRFEIIYWGTAFILSLAASRIVLGVHYTSDVVAGLLVGLFWLSAGCLLCRSGQHDRCQRERQH